jgi:hypothetical protein
MLSQHVQSFTVLPGFHPMFFGRKSQDGPLMKGITDSSSYPTFDGDLWSLQLAGNGKNVTWQWLAEKDIDVSHGHGTINVITGDFYGDKKKVVANKYISVI